MKKLLCLMLALIGPMMILAQQQWALPRLSVAHVRTSPSHAAEMSTQALMGTPLKVLNRSDDNQWIYVEMPDGYQGYIRSNSLAMMTDEEMAVWRSERRYVVTSIDERKVFADSTATVVVSDLVDGDIVVGRSRCGRWLEVQLPDGRCGVVNSSDVMPIEEWSHQPLLAEAVIAVAARYLGTPYTWGGNSSKGMDCSGLVKMAFYHFGVILRRDAGQQACWGLAVNASNLQPGDLVFYGNTSTQKVDHVAIYVGNDNIIESSGMVKYGSPATGKRFLSARRVIGEPQSEGIVVARSHSWYF